MDWISMGLNTFFAPLTDGKTWTGPNIPRSLFNKLYRPRWVWWLPPPDVAELGLRSAQSYFVQFHDGKQKFNDLPDKLLKILEKKNNSAVDVMAIGSKNHFYVRFRDGTVHYNLPTDLTDLIKSKIEN